MPNMVVQHNSNLNKTHTEQMKEKVWWGWGEYNTTGQLIIWLDSLASFVISQCNQT